MLLENGVESSDTNNLADEPHVMGYSIWIGLFVCMYVEGVVSIIKRHWWALYEMEFMMNVVGNIVLVEIVFTAIDTGVEINVKCDTVIDDGVEMDATYMKDDTMIDVWIEVNVGFFKVDENGYLVKRWGNDYFGKRGMVCGDNM